MEQWKTMYMLSTRVSILFRNDVKNDYDGDRKATERQRRHYYIIIILERPPPRTYTETDSKTNNNFYLERAAVPRVGTHNKTGS